MAVGSDVSVGVGVKVEVGVKVAVGAIVGVDVNEGVVAGAQAEMVAMNISHVISSCVLRRIVDIVILLTDNHYNDRVGKVKRYGKKLLDQMQGHPGLARQGRQRDTKVIEVFLCGSS